MIDLIAFCRKHHVEVTGHGNEKRPREDEIVKA
jgi:hypothetical protein